MSDAPPSAPPAALRRRTQVLLAVAGVVGGAALMLGALRFFDPPILATLRPPPPAPPPVPNAPPPAAEAPTGPIAGDVRKWTVDLATVLASDEPRRALYASTPTLQDEYPTAQAWGAAAAALHDRLTEVSPVPLGDGGDFSVRSKLGDQGRQDIVTLTAGDGGRTTLFFEREHLVGFDVH